MQRVLGAPADRSGGGLPWPDEIQVWRNRARVRAFARNVSEGLSPRSVRVGARVAADNHLPRAWIETLSTGATIDGSTSRASHRGVDRNRYGFRHQSRRSRRGVNRNVFASVWRIPALSTLRSECSRISQAASRVLARRSIHVLLRWFFHAVTADRRIEMPSG